MNARYEFHMLHSLEEPNTAAGCACLVWPAMGGEDYYDVVIVWGTIGSSNGHGWITRNI